MTATPDLLALVEQTAAILKACASGYQLGTWIAGIADKLSAGLPLDDAETACVAQMAVVESNAPAGVPVDQAGPAQNVSLGVASAPAGVDLQLTGDEAAALAALLAGQTDPVLQSIAAALSAAQGGST